MNREVRDALISLGVSIGLIGVLTGGITSAKAIEDRVNYNRARSKVEQILDADKNGKLSENEIKRFYDETGLSPYNALFKSVSRKDLEKFASHYELRWIRKE